MTASQREAADRRLDSALSTTGARDPREFYRERLRELKVNDEGAYREAVAHFEETLVPAVASGEVDPLAAWTDYGRRLAELTLEGRTVSIDTSGRAEPYVSPADPGALVLHLPVRGSTALLVALPPDLSPAQRATYDWMVGGQQRRRDA